jgi:hypothetical protein
MGEGDMMMPLCFFGSHIKHKNKLRRKSQQNIPQALAPNMEEDLCGLQIEKEDLYPIM